MKNEQNLSPVEGVHVGERIIPVPTSISQEAQAMLRAAVQYDGTPLNALYPIPAPNDRAAWRQLQAAAEAHYAAALNAATNETSTEIETRRLGTATVHVALPEARGSKTAFSSTCMAARSYSVVAMPVVRAHGYRQTGSG